jgi:hypothetical protein
MIRVRPGLGTHPHADQSIHRSGGSFSGRFNPRCRLWVGRRNPAMSLVQAMSASVSGPIPASLDASSALR